MKEVLTFKTSSGSVYTLPLSQPYISGVNNIKGIADGLYREHENTMTDALKYLNPGKSSDLFNGHPVMYEIKINV